MLPERPVAAKIRPQLASLPKKAVLTNGLVAMVLARGVGLFVRLCAVDVNRNEFGGTFAVADDGLGQLGGDVSECCQKGSVRRARAAS